MSVKKDSSKSDFHYKAGTKKTKPINVKTIVARVGISLLSFLLLLVIGIMSAVAMVHKGPSISARNLFAATVTETSAMKFLATWFMSDAEIAKIMGEDDLVDQAGNTTTDLIDIPDDGDDSGSNTVDKKAEEIIDIQGRSFTGKMMIIQDPKRISIGTPPAGYGHDKKGVKTIDMAIAAGAYGAVNGGGFNDYSGKGDGGVPIGRREEGIVITGGKMLWGSLKGYYEVIGINKDGVMVLGKMTGKQAMDANITEAINFGPYLVMNGEPNSTVGEAESGLNPRTAIGQRKDGAILLLVINGRQSNSLGATYEDLIEIMMEYGAVNAANLDGGSSSYMVHNDEIITTCASLYGPRKMATSILVKKASK